MFQQEVDHHRVRFATAWRTAVICRKRRRARCEHLGVRIGAVLEEYARHLDPSGVDRLHQRTAHRQRLIFVFANLRGLVRVQASVEQLTQHGRTIVSYCRLEQSLAL